MITTLSKMLVLAREGQALAAANPSDHYRAGTSDYRPADPRGLCFDALPADLFTKYVRRFLDLPSRCTFAVTGRGNLHQHKRLLRKERKNQLLRLLRFFDPREGSFRDAKQKETRKKWSNLVLLKNQASCVEVEQLPLRLFLDHGVADPVDLTGPGPPSTSDEIRLPPSSSPLAGGTTASGTVPIEFFSTATTKPPFLPREVSKNPAAEPRKSKDAKHAKASRTSRSFLLRQEVEGVALQEEEGQGAEACRGADELLSDQIGGSSPCRILGAGVESPSRRCTTSGSSLSTLGPFQDQLASSQSSISSTTSSNIDGWAPAPRARPAEADAGPGGLAQQVPLTATDLVFLLRAIGVSPPGVENMRDILAEIEIEIRRGEKDNHFSPSGCTYGAHQPPAAFEFDEGRAPWKSPTAIRFFLQKCEVLSDESRGCLFDISSLSCYELKLWRYPWKSHTDTDMSRTLLAFIPKQKEEGRSARAGASSSGNDNDAWSRLLQSKFILDF